MGIISSLPASCTNVFVKAFFFMNQEEDDGRLVSTFDTCILDHPRMLTSADEECTNIFRKVLFWPRVAKFGRGVWCLAMAKRDLVCKPGNDSSDFSNF